MFYAFLSSIVVLFIYLLNIYFNLSQLALKYLKDTKVNINNVLIITEDFNIRNNLWDLLFSYHLIHRNTLTDIVDFFQLCISSPTVQVSMRYMDNWNNSNSVMNLMFLRPMLEKFNNHSIHIDWRLFSDHAPLTVKFLILKEKIKPENIQSSKIAKEITILLLMSRTLSKILISFILTAKTILKILYNNLLTIWMSSGSNTQNWSILLSIWICGGMKSVRYL